MTTEEQAELLGELAFAIFRLCAVKKLTTDTELTCTVLGTPERLQALKEVLLGTTRMADLARRLHVAPITIRHDLARVSRVCHGVFKARNLQYSKILCTRDALEQPERTRVIVQAVELVQQQLKELTA